MRVRVKTIAEIIPPQLKSKQQPIAIGITGSRLPRLTLDGLQRSKLHELALGILLTTKTKLYNPVRTLKGGPHPATKMILPAKAKAMSISIQRTDLPLEQWNCASTPHRRVLFCLPWL